MAEKYMDGTENKSQDDIELSKLDDDDIDDTEDQSELNRSRQGDLPLEGDDNADDNADVNYDNKLHNASESSSPNRRKTLKSWLSRLKKRITTSDNDISYSLISLIWDLISLITYVTDIGSDIWVAVLYARNGDWWWFGLTLTFVFAPCVTWGPFFFFQWCQNCACSACDFQTVATALPGGLILVYIWMIFQGLRMRKNEDERILRKLELSNNVAISAAIRLIEAFTEAAPQLVLQLYIIFRGHGDMRPLLVYMQWISVTTSLCSLSWAVVSYHKCDRINKNNKANVSICGLILQFLWRTFTIGARVLSLALFAAYLPYAIFILVGIHWILMAIWLGMQQPAGLCRLGCEKWLVCLLWAFVYVFCCHPTTTHGHSRLQYVFYYMLVYMENAGMLFAWYFNTEPVEAWHPWYRYLICATVLGGFIIGILFQVLYYSKFHPNHFANNPKYPPIKVFVPCSELSCFWGRPHQVHKWSGLSHPPSSQCTMHHDDNHIPGNQRQ